jgi:hypothetical protein
MGYTMDIQYPKVSHVVQMDLQLFWRFRKNTNNKVNKNLLLGDRNKTSAVFFMVMYDQVDQVQVNGCKRTFKWMYNDVHVNIS